MRKSMVIAVLVILLVAALNAPAAQGQADPRAGLTLVVHDELPVLARGAAGEWDSGVAAHARVVHDGAQFHMFYVGGDDLITGALAVGYATSPDGLTWTKYVGNPVLTWETGLGVGIAVPVQDGEQWVLYFTPRAGPGVFNGQAVYRATAPTPTGPWTVDEQPVLERGQPGDWDRVRVVVNAVVRTDAGYTMVYTGATDVFTPAGIGVATSADGVTWTRADDPATTHMRYRHSDPALISGPYRAWDDYFVWFGSAVQRAEGWEMVYSGGRSGPVHETFLFGLGYAVSADGVQWTRAATGPALTLGDTWQWEPWSPSMVIVDDMVYVYFTTFPAAGMDYYDYYAAFPAREFSYAIGVATGHRTDS